MRKIYSIHLDTAPAAVYDYVSDVARHPEWAHERIETEWLSGAGAGATFSYTVHFMGEIKGQLTVLKADRPATFSYLCEEPSGAYRWTFEVSPEADGTRLTHVFEPLRKSLRIKLMMPIMLPLVGNGMIDGGLSNIKARVDAGAPLRA